MKAKSDEENKGGGAADARRWNGLRNVVESRALLKTAFRTASTLKAQVGQTPFPVCAVKFAPRARTDCATSCTLVIDPAVFPVLSCINCSSHITMSEEDIDRFPALHHHSRGAAHPNWVCVPACCGYY